MFARSNPIQVKAVYEMYFDMYRMVPIFLMHQLSFKNGFALIFFSLLEDEIRFYLGAVH